MKSRSELQAKVSNWWQLAGIQRSRLVGGKGEGVEIMDFRTGGGLRLQLLPGRGMDIGLAEFKGIPLSWISPVGVTHPHYFDSRGEAFLDSCGGGLLFTCGLTQVGAPCKDEDEELGLHGLISNTPAAESGCRALWTEDRYLIEAWGEVQQVSLLGYHLSLKRTYRAHLGGTRIFLSDQVRNEGTCKAPHMILYHFNFGYPLVDEGAAVLCPSKQVRGRDQTSSAGVGDWSPVGAPGQGFSEELFYHRLKAGDGGSTLAALINPDLEIGVILRFNLNQLPCFLQWKSLNDGVYAIGLEPANCSAEGRASDRRKGILEFLEAGEERSYHLEMQVVEGRDQMAEIRKSIREV